MRSGDPASIAIAGYCRDREGSCLGGLLPDTNVASNQVLRSNIGFDVTSGICVLCASVFSVVNFLYPPEADSARQAGW